MKIVSLTKGMISTVDDGDWDEVSKYKWRSSMSARGIYYAASFIGGKHVRLHQFLMRAPAGMEVDHVNRNSLDNRRENLRVCTHQQNTQNCSKRNSTSSQYKGVCWNKREKKWMAYITIHGKRHYLGCCHGSEDGAARAYDAAARAAFGEFAHCNLKQEFQ